MPLQFISYRELAFRQLMGMLRTPPFAMMSYYSNLFLTARFVLSDQPEKLKYLDKEIRRVEIKVGIKRTQESYDTLKMLQKIWYQQKSYKDDMAKIEVMVASLDKQEERNELIEVYKRLADDHDKLELQEHYLLFKLEPVMDLKTVETFMDNDINLKSYFKEGGVKVLQLDITSELEKIKNWIYEEATEIMKYIRFTKLE